MIAMIIKIIGFACVVHVAYIIGKFFGIKEGFNDGFREGHIEAYRKVENIIDKTLAHAKDTTTEGA